MEWGMPSEKGILCKHRDMSCLYWILVQPLNCFCAQEQSYYRVEKILILDGKYWDEQLGTAGGTHKGYHLLTYIRDQGWWALDAFGRCFNLRVLIWIYSMETSSQVTWSNSKDNTSPKRSPCSWGWEKMRFPCAVHKGLRCCKIYQSAIGTAMTHWCKSSAHFLKCWIEISEDIATD